MAFKLTKEEKTRRDQLVRDLGSLICQIEDEVNNYNAEVEKLRTYVEPVVKRYNALAAEVATAGKRSGAGSTNGRTSI
jgi:hypothetical protein